MTAKLGTCWLVAVMALLASARTSQGQIEALPAVSEQESPELPALKSLVSWDDPVIGAPPETEITPEGSLADSFEIPTPRWMQEAVGFSQGPIPVSLGRPGLDPGWIGSMEIDILQPRIASEINSGTQVAGTFPGNPIQLPVGNLNFTAAPRIEMGYRWPEGLGEFRLSYRRVQSTGSQTIADTAPGSTRSLATTLQINVVDFDYCFTELQPFNIPVIPVVGPLLKVPGRLGLRRPPQLIPGDPIVLRYRLGIRALTIYNESVATGALTLNERVMNNFGGVGLKSGIEISKAMPWRPLSLYAKGDFTFAVGGTNQAFSRTTALGASASAREFVNEGITMALAEAGVRWVPAPYRRNISMTLGYQFETWWNFADTADSTASLQLSGVALRGEWGF
jgi:hypothetical protein